MAILIEPGLLSPVPPKSEPGVCVSCLNKRANWVFRRDESWCAYCFLYDTDWARLIRDDIINFAKVVEMITLRPILEEDAGRVLETESDRILSAIVFGSLVKYSQDNKVRKQ